MKNRTPEFAKWRMRRMSVDEYIEFMKEKMPEETFDREHIAKLPEGTCLGAYHNKETGRKFRIVLQKVFIREFELQYSTTKKRPKGKEILISNFRLPAGKIV